MRKSFLRTGLNCLLQFRKALATNALFSTRLILLTLFITVCGTASGGSPATPAHKTSYSYSVPPTPTVSAGGPTSFCQGGNVVLTAASTGSTAYQWYLNGGAISGAISQTYTASASGSYTVTGNNSSGASAQSAPTSVTINPTPATPTVTAQGSTSFCLGGNVILAANASGASSYQWYLNGTSVSGATTQTYTATAAGNYAVTSTNANGCSSAASAPTSVTPLPAPAAPTVSVSGPTTFCSGGSVILAASAAGANSFQWFLNGASISGASANTYTTSASGNYTVVVTNTNGCTSAASAPTTVTVNPATTTPIISASGPTTFCSGGSVTFTASAGAATYQWFLNGGAISGASAATYTANTSGSYSVSITNTNGCKSSTSLSSSVSINPTPATPTVTANGNTPVCQGGTVLLTANGSGATAYQWFQGGTSIPGATGATYAAGASGSYTVDITDANGCISPASGPTPVTIVPTPAAPTISAGGPTSFCPGGSVTLTASGTGAVSYQWFQNGIAITGANNNIYTANTSGDFTVDFVNSNGCTSSTSAVTTVTVNVAPVTPAISAGGPTGFCQGGSVVLTASPTGAGNFQWLQNGTPIAGATGTTYTAATSGNYTVTITQGCASSASAIIPVTAYTPLATPGLSAGGPTTICQGNSVLLTANTTDASNFQWFLNGTAISGANAQTFAAGTAGSYTVTVSNPCNTPAASLPITVSVNPTPAQPTVSAGGAITFCAPGSVVLTASPSGAFAYQWFQNGISISGATTQTYTATATGSYTVTTINSFGCPSPPSNPIPVVAYPALTPPGVTAGGPTSFCAGSNVVLTATAPAPITFQWLLNGTAISGATGASYTVTTAGSYTVTASNPCSSATSTPTVVTVNPSPTTPTINASGPTTYCSGGSVVLTANATGVASFQWSLNGIAITGATAQTYTVTSNGGDYTVLISNAGGCTALSAPTTVTVYAALSAVTLNITAAGPTTFCAGGNVALTANATGASNYQWFFDGIAITGATTAAYTATVSGSYTAYVSNPCSSVTSSPITVTVNPAPATPTVTAGGNTTLCAGDSVILSANASGATGYQWFSSGTFIPGETTSTDTVKASGSYTVQVTNANGCTSAASVNTVVVVNPTPAAPTLTPAGPTTFCQGSSVVLNASPTGADYYDWYQGATFTGTTTSASDAAYVSGSYTATITDANGCISAASAPITVTVNPNPAAPTLSAGGPTTLCSTDSVILTATATGANTYQWLLNGTSIPGAITNTDTAKVSGSYTISITDINGCGATSANTTVTVNPVPTTPILSAGGTTTFCSGDSVLLSADANNASVYQWFLGGTLIAGATTDTLLVKASGTYTVSITDANGCNSGASFSTAVTVNPTPTAPAITAGGPLTVCPGQVLLLSANPAGAASYQWFLNGTAVNDSTNPTYATTGAGSYTVDAVSSFGCMSPLSAVAVVTNPCLPMADLSLVKQVSPGPYSVQKPVTYTLTLTNNGPDTAMAIVISDTLTVGLGDPSNYGGTGPVPTYDAINRVLTWDIPPLDSGATVTFTFDIPIKSLGTNVNTGYVSSSTADPDTANNHSTATFTIAGDLFIPNLVTPNGDGKNDYFVVLGLNKYPGSSLRVFNRWGSEVYQSQNYNNDWGGGNLNDGTYFYILLVNTPTGKQAYKGWIEILH